MSEEPFYWPEDAAVFGAHCWRMTMTRGETERDARAAGCPDRLLFCVLAGWDRARLHALHTEG